MKSHSKFSSEFPHNVLNIQLLAQDRCFKDDKQTKNLNF